MEKYNLLIILDSGITEINATDRTAASVLTFSGEPSIELNDTPSIDEALQNILCKFSLETLKDAIFDIVIINNGTDERYISELFNRLSGAYRIRIVDSEAVIPFIVQLMSLDAPATVSLNSVSYRLDENGVSRISSCANAVSVPYEMLSFLFDFNKRAFQNSARVSVLVSENEALKQENEKLIVKNTSLEKECQSYIVKIDELTAKVNQLQKQIEEKNTTLLSTPKPILYRSSNKTIYFGTHNGKPLMWNVLVEENDRILVIANEAVGKMPFNVTSRTNCWADCSLRNWLNNTFFSSAFNEQAQAAILTTTVKTDEKTTEDKLFLLSTSDTINLFIAHDDKQKGYRWWLRTPSSHGIKAAFVDFDGCADGIGESVTSNYMVLPAMWIAIKR